MESYSDYAQMQLDLLSRVVGAIIQRMQSPASLTESRTVLYSERIHEGGDRGYSQESSLIRTSVN
jgi:hypothetical protein